MKDKEIKDFLEKLATDNNYSNVFILGFTKDKNEHHDFIHYSLEGIPEVFRMAFECWFSKNYDNMIECCKEAGGNDNRFNDFLDTLKKEPVDYDCK